MSGPHAPGFYTLTNKSDKTFMTKKYVKIKIAICYSGTNKQSETKYSLLIGQWQLAIIILSHQF